MLSYCLLPTGTDHKLRPTLFPVNQPELKPMIDKDFPHQSQTNSLAVGFCGEKRGKMIIVKSC